MNAHEKLAELKGLEAKAAKLRTELGISPPGKVIFLAPRDTVEDDVVVVEADGVGGATTMIVEGNYPIDFFVKYERVFSTEEDAEAAAERIAFEAQSPTIALKG